MRIREGECPIFFVSCLFNFMQSIVISILFVIRNYDKIVQWQQELCFMMIAVEEAVAWLIW